MKTNNSLILNLQLNSILSNVTEKTWSKDAFFEFFNNDMNDIDLNHKFIL